MEATSGNRRQQNHRQADSKPAKAPAAGLSANFRHTFRGDEKAFAGRRDGAFDTGFENLAGEWTNGARLARRKVRDRVAEVPFKTAGHGRPLVLGAARYLTVRLQLGYLDERFAPLRRCRHPLAERLSALVHGASEIPSCKFRPEL
jgi:hypothetical protein